MVKRMVGMEVHGRKRRARPRWRWMDGVNNDMTARGLTKEQGQNRAVRRKPTRNIDPT